MAQDGERRVTRGLTFEEIKLGMQASVENTVMDQDIRSFATVSGDYNPVFGIHLPGPSAIYVTQTLNFKRPVWIGDVIRTKVTVAEMFPQKRRVRFECACRNGEGMVVLEGKAMLMIPEREAAA